MNNSSEIFSIHGFNSSDDIEMETDSQLFLAACIFSILISFAVCSYVIWLIVTGTGNGLASAFFILNLCVCQIILCIEIILIYFTYKFPIHWALVVFLDGLTITGRPLFECLISVERYLAVVHPVIFLKFKPLRYRLMCSAVVWTVTVVFGGLNVITMLFAFIVYTVFLIQFLVFLSIQLFCCVAVLRVLKQSGPGERGREREEENHMKKRAFYLILITTVSTFITYIPYFVFTSLISSQNAQKFVWISMFSFVLAGLVQPFLFLFQVGKLKFK